MPRQIHAAAYDIPPEFVTSCAQAIFCAAQHGQPEAIELVLQHAQHFAIGVINLINILNPQRIIIWGESVAAGDLFLITVRKFVKMRALHGPRETCEIVFSHLNQDVGLIGAGTLAIDALFEGVHR